MASNILELQHKTAAHRCSFGLGPQSTCSTRLDDTTNTAHRHTPCSTFRMQRRLHSNRCPRRLPSRPDSTRCRGPLKGTAVSCSYDPAKPTAVITGASSGIGQAAAMHLAEQGWNVYAGARQQRDVESLEGAHPSITGVCLDVTDAACVRQVADRVAADVGSRGLDGLVNNAGVVLTGPLEFLPPDAVETLMAVNVTGVVRVTQALLPLLRCGAAPGRVLSLGSQAGTVALPMFAPYNCSKFALEALSDCLRYELEGQGIKVCLVKAGAVKTPIWTKSFAAADQAAEAFPPEATELYGDLMLQVRAGAERAAEKGVTVDEVAAVVLEALTSCRPRARYFVGREARLQMLARRLLPDRVWDRLLMGSLRKLRGSHPTAAAAAAAQGDGVAPGGGAEEAAQALERA